VHRPSYRDQRYYRRTFCTTYRLATMLHDWHTAVRYDPSRSSKVIDFYVIQRSKVRSRPTHHTLTHRDDHFPELVQLLTTAAGNKSEELRTCNFDVSFLASSRRIKRIIASSALAVDNAIGCGKNKPPRLLHQHNCLTDSERVDRLIAVTAVADKEMKIVS